MINIKKNTKPELVKPSFNVDGILSKKLNNYELTTLMNRHNFTLFLGKGGSGKTSLVISLIQTPSLFKGIYHSIILFCAPNSRASITNDFWTNALPEEQIYDDLTIETLTEAYDLAQENATDDFKTLFIIDDLQGRLKNNDLQKLLLHANNNKRHARLSIWLCCQNYKTIPLQVRMNLTDLFVFKISKVEQRNLFEEQIETASDKFEKILDIAYKNVHDFLYINTLTQRIFLNWDELKFL